MWMDHIMTQWLFKYFFLFNTILAHFKTQLLENKSLIPLNSGALQKPQSEHGVMSIFLQLVKINSHK